MIFIQKKVTISDVAKKAGVSTSTVSRVMSNTGRIGAATRERVQEVIERLNFQPSAIAKGLILSKNYNIGIVMPPIKEDDDFYLSDFFHLFLQGVGKVCKKYGYELLLSSGEEKEQQAIENFVQKQKVEGLILMRAYKDSYHVDKLQQLHFPFVVMGDPKMPEVSFVDNDYMETTFAITKKLFARYKERIAFLAYDPLLITTEDKLEGYRLGMQEMTGTIRQETSLISKTPLEVDGFLQDFIHRTPDPKALIAGDYVSFLSTMNFLKKQQLQIPQDIQIITFGNHPLFDFFAPSVTTIDTFPMQQGEKAALMLVHKIENKSFPNALQIGNEVYYRDFIE